MSNIRRGGRLAQAFAVLIRRKKISGNRQAQPLPLFLERLEDRLVPANISGRTFNDLNGDGSGNGDPGQGGITIQLIMDTNNNGINDDAVFATTPTAASTGTYSFTNLGPARYFVQEVVPAAAIKTFGPAFYTIVASSGSNVTGQDFGNFTLVTFGGRTFNDLNGNGSDNSDPGQAGVTIQLIKDTNNNGINDDAVFATTPTAANTGTYSFTNLGPARYFVEEVVPAATIRTSGPAFYTIVASSGSNVTAQDFGNFTLIAISGRTFSDLNGDGSSNGDPGQGGVTIQLIKDTNNNGINDDAVFTTTPTAANTGTYSFTNLGPGRYFVQEVVPSVAIKTFGPAFYTIVASSGANVPAQDFGNFTLITISGHTFNDLDANGTDNGDPGQGGVTIQLIKDSNNNGMNDDAVFATTTTAASTGTYSFANLGPGRYFVQEVVPAGTVRTAGPAFYTIVASSGSNVAAQDFGNNNKSIVINGSSGADTLVLNATNSNSGSYSLNGSPAITFATITSFSFNGQGNNDTMTVNTVGGQFAPASGLLFFGDGGSDVLIISDAGSSSGHTYTINAAGIIRDGTTAVTFNSVESVSCTGGNASDTFNVSPASSTTFNINGGPQTGAGDVLTLDAAHAALFTSLGKFTVNGGQPVTFTGIERFNLNNAAGISTFYGPDTADRDQLAGLSDDRRFVRVLFLNALGRAGTLNELDAWVNVLKSNPNGASLVAAGIEGSAEGRHHLVRTWYQTYLGRQAQNNEEQPWVNLLLAGQSEEATLSSILGSQEFLNRAQTLVGTGTTNERFVQALYLLLLNRTASAGEVASHLAILSSAGRDGDARGFLSSGEFRTYLVDVYYETLLHRLSDPSGLNAWLNSGIDAFGIRLSFDASGEFFSHG
jgi:sarcosine oxidase gamma subunit